MSEYDPFDDMPNYDTFTDYPKNYVKFSDLTAYLNTYPFYIKNNVDPYIEDWNKFLSSVLENGELQSYDLRFMDVSAHKFFDQIEDFPDERVEVIPSHPENIGWGEFIGKTDFFELAYSYGISSCDKYREIMEKTFKQYEFMLDMFNSNNTEISVIKVKNCKYTQKSKVTQTWQAHALQNWQQAFRYMIEIRDICLKEGPAKRTEQQL